MFCDAAITKAQLLHVFKHFSWLVVWLECLLEGLYKFLVCPPIWFIALRFFAFLNLCLNELLFSDSGISSC
jgi:hypothetical protein